MSNIPLLVSVFLASLTTGATTYTFGLYGNALKETLNLTEAQLDTISSATFCAGLFSWLPGLCVDRFGPRCSLSSGGIIGATALMLFWTVARQFVVVPRYILVQVLSFLGVIVFLCSALITGGVFKVIVSTCGEGSKGSAVGAAKGYVGLGAGVYAVLFESIRQPSQTDLDFLPMSALFFVVAAALPATCLLPVQGNLEERVDLTTPLHFKTLYLGLVTLAFLVAGESVVRLLEGGSSDHQAGGGLDEQKKTRDFIIAACVLLAWFGPILSLGCIPVSTRSSGTEIDDPGSAEKGRDPASLDPEEIRSLHVGDSLGEMESLGNEEIEQEEEEYPPEVVPARLSDRNLGQMLSTVSAWLMVWTCTILVGSGTVMTNMMGQMVSALRFSPSVNPSALALFSVAQAFARVFTGTVSESALQWRVGGCRHGVARPSFLIVASLVGAIAHLLLAVAITKVSFIFGVALSGVAFGMSWPLMVLIVGELFGTTNMGANYMFYDGVTSAIGTLVLSKLVAQEVYDAHTTGEGEHNCYGTGCFRATNLVIAVLCLTCIASSVSMLFTPLTRKAYRIERPLEST